jgi:hypothetical protein
MYTTPQNGPKHVAYNTVNKQSKVACSPLVHSVLLTATVSLQTLGMHNSKHLHAHSTNRRDQCQVHSVSVTNAGSLTLSDSTINSTAGDARHRLYHGIVKSQAVPLQAWTGPWVIRQVKAPDFLDVRH